MKVLLFNLMPNSLFSIRIPFTWQSALTYPLPPPSTIIGMVANAIQRAESVKHPMDYLSECEQNIIWSAATLRGYDSSSVRIVLKSHIVSTIMRFDYELGGKGTNALGRQFGFVDGFIRCALLSENSEFLIRARNALLTSPVTLGDSESTATVISVSGPLEMDMAGDKEFRSNYPVPLRVVDDIVEGGTIFWVHERCIADVKKKDIPLYEHIFPIVENKGIWEHKPILGRVLDGGKIWVVGDEKIVVAERG